MIRRVRGWAMLATLALLLATVPAVAAHGAGSHLPPLDAGTALTAWSVDPIISLVLIAFGAAYLLAFRAVNRRHPASPVRAWRAAAWIGGLLAVAFALEGSPDVYAEALFSVHMVQHLLLVAIAAPLFALAAPVTLLLRVVSAAIRTRFVLPVLHSRLVGVMTHPLVAWIAFAVVMWGSHFSPLFDAALENPLIHHFEHALYLGAGMLFWWPVVAADPVRHRLGWTARIAYLGTALPWNSFLGVAIYFAPNVLYAHYATTVRTWGPTPLLDQQAAGAVMWVGGDLAFLVALLLVIAGLLADEERKGRIYDARMDARAH
jgi:cytochrome c oxidase assembly factor CtaG